MTPRLRWCLAMGLACLAGNALAAGECDTRKYYECYDYEDSEEGGKTWQEFKATMPPAPDPDKLIPFEVSVANANRFYIDPVSVSVGKDGVVRYTVVIEAAGGARTVNYEGLRCETRERRLYAFGQPDGTWIENQGAGWAAVHKQQHKMHNGYQAVLFDEYFCVDRIPVTSPDAATDALRRGAATFR